MTGIVAFVGGFVFSMPMGCDDVGGVPSWERCTSAMGTPAFSPAEDFGLPFFADLLVPLVLAASMAGLMWWISGRSVPAGPDD